jgi:Mg-chelatase subunit ChlD
MALLVAFSLLVPSGRIAADEEAFCGDVQLVWARGTSTPPDDPTFQEVDESLASRLGGDISYSVYQLGRLGGTDGFDYPAAGDGFHFFLEWTDFDIGDYHASKEEGKQELDAYLTRRALQCPGEVYVLGGWSQGANVIGEGLFLLDPFVRDRIAFVALFGDPTLDTGFDTMIPAELAGPFLDACNGQPKPWIRGSAPCWSPGGVFGRRDPYVPDDLATRVGSWCRGGDFACTTLPQVIPSTDTEHRAYFDPDSDAAMAMREAAERLQAFVPDQANDIDATFLQFATGAAGADLVFVFDTTGSMGGEIADAKSQATALANLWLDLAVNGRVALVQFRDHGDSFVSRLELPLTGDASAFQAAVDRLVANEGGDTPEAQLSGLMTALNELDWQDGATKVAIVITDAPGKDPEPITGLTRAQVSQRALEIDPVAIFGVDVIGFAQVQDFMRPMAEATAGEVFVLQGGQSLSDLLFDVIDVVAFNPVATLNGPYFAAVGTAVHFRASGSFDPDGEIASYEWDFDGNGVTDVTTSTPDVEHVYEGAFDGLAAVRVIAADGGEALATAEVTVDSVGLAAHTPLKPTSATATVTGPNEVTVTWVPAADDRADHYVVRLRDSLLARGTAAGDGTSVVFSGVDPSQSLEFIVRAVNEFGYSAGAVATVGGADTTPPTSLAGPLPSTTPASAIDVPFTASDAGSGIDTVELWVRHRPNPVTAWGAWTIAGSAASSPIRYAFANGDGLYEFYTVAADVAGNREAPPAVADAAVHRDAVDDPPAVSFGWDIDAVLQCTPRTGCVPLYLIRGSGTAADDRSTITAIDYRIYAVEPDGSRRRLNNWRAATPTDGAFDSKLEGYRIGGGAADGITDYEFEIRVTAGGVRTIFMVG